MHPHPFAMIGKKVKLEDGTEVTVEDVRGPMLLYRDKDGKMQRVPFRKVEAVEAPKA